MDSKLVLFNAIKAGDSDSVKSLLVNNPELAKAHDEQGVSAILTAAYYGRKQVVEALTGSNPQMDIWEAAATGNMQRVNQLLDQDHSLVNATAPDGFTPLGLAAFFGQKAVLENLIARGAEVNQASNNEMHVRPIHSAAAHHNPIVAKEMLEVLLKHGAEVNATQSGGWTALHEAASRGEVEMVRLLKRYGADKATQSEDGKTPKDLAKEKGHANVQALL